MKRLFPLLCGALLLTGCAESSAFSPAAQQSPEPEPEVVYDMLYTDSRDGYSFLAFRTPELPDHNPGDWLTAENWEPIHGFQPETDYPAGSFVEITADVTILNGGEAGYCNEPKIRNLIDVRPVAFADAMQRVSAPDETAEYWQRVRKIETPSGTYLIIYDETVYRDGALIGDYSRWSNDAHGALRPLYAQPLLLDYLMPDSLPLTAAGAEMFEGGAEVMPQEDPVRILETVFWDHPEYVLTENAEPLNAEQLRKCRESGVFIFVRPADRDFIWIGDPIMDTYYDWCSLCGESADGALTLTLQDGRSWTVANSILSEFRTDAGGDLP